MINTIQYLRALAATAIVVYHSLVHIAEQNAGWPTGYVLQSGLDLFFVISGFIMWSTTANATTTPSQFLYRRAMRIVPIYWLATLAMFAMPFISRTISGGTVQDLWHLIGSLLFIPHEAPNDPGRYYPVLVTGWTINFEAYFYGLFALALLVVDRTRRFLAIITCLAALVCIGSVSPNQAISWSTSPLMLEFGLGLVIAWLYAGGRASPAIIACAIVTGCLLFVAQISDANALEVSRFLRFGLPSALLVSVAIVVDRHVARPVHVLRFLGDASYSIYLMHLFTVGAVAAVWYRLGLWHVSGGILAYLIVSVLVSLCFAAISYILLERPIWRWARGRPMFPAAVRPEAYAAGAKAGY